MDLPDYPDRSQLQQIIAGITEGVMLIEPDQAITYANEAALAMHKVEGLDDLGRTVDAYERNFVVRYRTKQAIDDAPTPIQRVVTGEMFEDVVVEVAHRDRPRADWVHRIRSLVVTTRDGMHDCWVLIMTDVSGHLEAEERFERMFAANPAPAVICRLSDLRFVKLNEGFLSLTGLKADDVLGRSVYEIDVSAEIRQSISPPPLERNLASNVRAVPVFASSASKRRRSPVSDQSCRSSAVLPVIS